MAKRWLQTVTAFSILLTVIFLAWPEEYELAYNVLDSRQEGVYPVGDRLARATVRPEEKLVREPKYRSTVPIYGVVTLGNAVDNKYTFVLDESEGTGQGYDLLYADRNNNEDVTDDPKVPGRKYGKVIPRGKPLFYTYGNFGPFEVTVDRGDKTVSLYLSVRYYCGAGEPRIAEGTTVFDNVQLSIRTSGYYSGVVSLGKTKRRIAVVDYNCNGLFNECFKVRSDITGSHGELHATGDQLLIDLDGDRRFDAGPPDYKELFPYAKHVQIEGEWYSLDVAPHGGRIKIVAPPLKLGTITLPPQVVPCSLQLVSSSGVLKVEAAGQQVHVPPDTYQLYGYTAEVKHSSGSWRYEGQGTKSGKKPEVSEDTVSHLRLGTPLQVHVGYSGDPRGGQPKAGDTIKLSLTVSGQGGEIYDRIEKDGERPPPPTFRIVDETGKILTKGDFEYG